MNVLHMRTRNNILFISFVTTLLSLVAFAVADHATIGARFVTTKDGILVRSVLITCIISSSVLSLLGSRSSSKAYAQLIGSILVTCVVSIVAATLIICGYFWLFRPLDS